MKPLYQRRSQAAPASEEDDAGIDAEDLEGECIRWSASYAWCARLAADAEVEHKKAENRTKLARALVVVRVLSEAGRRPNALLASALADSQEDVVDAREEEAEALRTRRGFEGKLEALRGKKDMLVQLASKRRKEMEQEITVRETKGSK